MGIARVTYANGWSYARTYASKEDAIRTEVLQRGAVQFVWVPRDRYQLLEEEKRRAYRMKWGDNYSA